jgi:hypothetical protein
MKPLATVVLVLLTKPAIDAQPAADPRVAAQVSTDPIRCWWQSDAGAVTVGQSFSVTLTCAVIDTDAVQVVADESRLGVATVQVSPFEILGGSHPGDARNGSRRFFQYQYTLRIIDPDVIGKDVAIPNLPIQYRVRSRMSSASTLEGRDLTYVMPSLPIKVLSLVPADVTDIRDGAEAGFGAVDTLRFRSSLLRIVGGALAVIAGIVGVWALVPLARTARKAAPETAHHVPDRVVLNEVKSKLNALKTESDRGWSDDLVGQALRLVRLVSSLAIGRDVSQHPGAADGAPAFRLAVSHGFLRPARVSVASSVTADDVARAIGTMPSQDRAKRMQLESLREALTTLTQAAYRQSNQRDSAKLDEAVTAAITAAEGLAAEQSRLREWMSAGRKAGAS